MPKLTGALKTAFPSTFAPMLASLAEKPFSSCGWIFEPKMDGIRCLVAVTGGEVTLYSRRGLNMTHQYPVLVAELKDCIRTDALIDGEIIALDEAGKPSFQQLQQRMNLSRPADIAKIEARIPAYFFAFDVLFAVDSSVIGMPLMPRKELLRSLVTESHHVRLLQYFQDDGIAAYNACVDLGFEGVVAKRRDSRYEMGRRSPAWLKLKAQQTDDFVLIGFTVGEGWRSTTFGSILLAQCDASGKLVYAGSVGTGFDDKLIRDLMKRFEPLITTVRNLQKSPEGKGKITWLKPQLVAEIKFMERTNDGHLRAPVFLRLREDKQAEEAVFQPVVDADAKQPLPKIVEAAKATYVTVEAKASLVIAESTARRDDSLLDSVREQLKSSKDNITLYVGAETISLTTLGKLFWPASELVPAVTKRDYLLYLTEIAPFILPHLEGRPLTVVRAPNGVTGKPFFQKHWANLPEYFETTGVIEIDGAPQEFLLCNNLPTLLYVGQHSALELHTMCARLHPFLKGEGPGISKQGTECDIEELLEFPDFLVLDLDVHDKNRPAHVVRKEEFSQVCQVALSLKQPLIELGASPFVKVSGKGGLHIYVPVTRNLDYEHARVMSETLGQCAAKLAPALATTAYKVEQRIGKVYVDTSANIHRKTMIAPYSPRLTTLGTVSMPVTWGEVERCEWIPCAMADAVERLRKQGDLWKNILSCGIDIYKKISGGNNK